jgi:hypothetical protein
MLRGFSKALALCAFLASTLAGAQQINLKTQVTGVLQPANGGTGIDSSGATGCPRVVAGVWTISNTNCGGSPSFSITSFTGGSTVELGTSVVNPAFTASYSTTPAGAQITNTEGIDSPLVLTTPFTSGTVVGTFVHSTITTTTFTLSATQGATQTATQQIVWQPAIFGGVGTAGATSSVTASGTTAVLSTGDVLPRIQLGAETVNEVLGSFTPSGQVIYLLLTGGSHTFVDANNGFPLVFNSPIAVSFVNAQGATVSMFLYATVNPLFGNYKPKVAS